MNPRHLLAAFAAWVLGVTAVVEAGDHALGHPIVCERAFGPCAWRALNCAEIVDAEQREDCAWSEGYETFCSTLGVVALGLSPLAAVLCAVVARRSRGAAWPWWTTAAACAFALVRMLWLGLGSAVL
jgi:hypothetical protein